MDWILPGIYGLVRDIPILNKGIKHTINVASHVGLGAWTGVAINDPKYRHGLWACLVSYLVYQVHESHVKGDKGYPEIRQYMIGMAALLAIRRAWQAIRNRR